MNLLVLGFFEFWSLIYGKKYIYIIDDDCFVNSLIALYFVILGIVFDVGFGKELWISWFGCFLIDGFWCFFFEFSVGLDRFDLVGNEKTGFWLGFDLWVISTLFWFAFFVCQMIEFVHSDLLLCFAHSSWIMFLLCCVLSFFLFMAWVWSVLPFCILICLVA